MAHQRREHLDGVGADDELVVIAAKGVGDDARVRQLVERGLFEPDGKRLHRPVHQSRHDRDNRARVDATAQKRAERHVRQQPLAHRVGEQRHELGARVGLADRALWRVRQRPVPPDPNALAIPHEQMRRRQLADPAIDRERRGNRHVGQITVERIAIEPDIHEG